jgi:ubiquinone/menaquinone biosynthesis C-methylase UbiE
MLSRLWARHRNEIGNNMSIETAAAIVRIFGPCRILQWQAHDDNLLKELLLAGCDAYAVGTKQTKHPRWIAVESENNVPRTPFAVVDVASAPETFMLLNALLARHDLQGLCLIAHGRNTLRKSFENAIFSAGWRRHPASFEVWQYETLKDEALPFLSVYQRIPEAVAAEWPIEALLSERNLHMDMLRESGGRADAHVARYVLAASHVRPGDTVLDCACGLGYGSAVIAAKSQASKIIGIDVDAATVAYADANYGGQNVSFQVGNAAALDHIPDASVDFIVSMETLEHVLGWKAAAMEFARVLKPDGRLIASVPDRWVDETGNDPNPYHHHVFDWARLRDGLIDDFVIERRYVQAAPGGFKWTSANRTLQQIPLNAEAEAEWILVVASSNPFARAEQLHDSFAHPAFGAALTASGAPIVDFARFYDNPWLYRTLVQMGERLGDDDTLRRLAEWVSDTARPGSADQGAALCVYGYRILEQRQANAAAPIIQAIEVYHAATGEAGTVTSNPHVQRWRISLAFLAGRLSELCGAHDEALGWFSRTVELDWRCFSPILATKTVSAAFHAARLSLARDDEAGALTFFRLGLKEALEAARGDGRDIIGTIDTPITFGLTELAEVMQMGGQCATAIASLPLWRRSPGTFWRQVDMKQFGLATWARDVEMENRRLRIASR